MKRIRLQTLAALGGFGLLLLPISYAVIEDARSSELCSRIREAFRRTASLPMEGEGRIRITVRERTFEVHSRFTGDQVRVVKAVRDGRPVTLRRGGRRFHPVRRIHGFVKDIDLALRNYRLVPRGTETIANRPCVRYDMVSRHADRPLCSIWIDEKARLIVRRRLEDKDHGRLIDVRLDSVRLLGEAPVPRKGPRRPRHLPRPASLFNFDIRSLKTPQDRSGVGFEVVDLPRLPHGFVRRCYYHARADLTDLLGIRIEVVFAIYTDGIHVVSIVQLPTTDYEKLLDMARIFRHPEYRWFFRKILHAGGPGGPIRRGLLATAERGETTLLGVGTISREEIALLVSRFLE